MTSVRELYGRPWSEREFIIVLHYYVKYEGEPRHSGSEYIRKLSRLLGRTPGAVVMRMENYSSIDPEVGNKRVGLININSLGRRVFEQWMQRRDALEQCGEAFIRDAEAANIPTLFNPTPVKIPKAFGRYELLDQLGDGAGGVVFSCIDTDENNPYAIKIIRTDRIHERDVFHRFLREIRALRSIHHPNVIRLHEDNLESERTFPAFVMDLGTHSLTSYVDEVRRENSCAVRPLLPSKQAEDIVCDIMNAVEALHVNTPRLIHRDINPNNILRMSDDRWVLSDFGLAKFLSTAPISTSFQTTTQRGWGTMWYTAPEQYDNFASVDERADIYSLGMLVWELFTESGPPPNERDNGLAGSLESVYLKATARDPNDRYTSVREMRESFQKAL